MLDAQQLLAKTTTWEGIDGKFIDRIYILTKKIIAILDHAERLLVSVSKISLETNILS